MNFPLSDVVVLSAVAAFVSAGITTWWWFSRATRDVRYALEPVTTITQIAPKPSNQCGEDAAPDSGVRVRVGARMRAVD